MVIFDKKLKLCDKNLHNSKKSCTFAPILIKTMKKMYNTPKIDLVVMPEEALLAFQPSPQNDPNAAPARHNVAPVVPGDNL